jgi:hypothetical protein
MKVALDAVGWFLTAVCDGLAVKLEDGIRKD